MELCCCQVIKNLLFVAKVIYLISPESDSIEGQEQIDEEEDEQEAAEEDEKEEENERPPSLLWVMKKLSVLAKREAADTPKVPLKVTVMLAQTHTQQQTLILIHKATVVCSS